MNHDAELIVFSHLRWVWVWQRPQHLVSRLARGQRTLFVEEPVVADVEVPVLRSERHGPVERVWLEVPDRGAEQPSHPGFDHPDACHYARLAERLDPGSRRTAWLYSPLALPAARAIVRGAARENYTLASLVAGIVKSVPFQMREKPIQ